MVNNSAFSKVVSCAAPNCLTETGGLLRIGVKLMMACSTTKADGWVRYNRPLTCSQESLLQKLRPTRQSHRHLLSDQR